MTAVTRDRAASWRSDSGAAAAASGPPAPRRLAATGPDRAQRGRGAGRPGLSPCAQVSRAASPVPGLGQLSRSGVSAATRAPRLGSRARAADDPVSRSESRLDSDDSAMRMGRQSNRHTQAGSDSSRASGVSHGSTQTQTRRMMMIRRPGSNRRGGFHVGRLSRPQHAQKGLSRQVRVTQARLRVSGPGPMRRGRAFLDPNRSVTAAGAADRPHDRRYRPGPRDSRAAATVTASAAPFRSPPNRAACGPPTRSPESESLAPHSARRSTTGRPASPWPAQCAQLRPGGRRRAPARRPGPTAVIEATLLQSSIPEHGNYALNC